MSSQKNNSVFSLALVIILLVLTSLATVVYGGSAKDKERINNSIFWRTTKTAFDYSLSFLGIITQNGLNTSGVNKQENSVHNYPSNNENNKGIWSHLKTKAEDAWNYNSQQANSNISTSTEQIKKFIEWKTKPQGAEIILHLDKKSEYKLNLPWRFLGSH